jgi:hypothetical protein
VLIGLRDFRYWLVQVKVKVNWTASTLTILRRTEAKTLLATTNVAFVGCHGNPVYRAVTWIALLGHQYSQHVGCFHGRLPHYH